MSGIAMLKNILIMILSKNKTYLLLFLLFAGAQLNKLSAQFFVIEEEPNRLYYEFAVKRVTNFWEMKNFRDVFHKDKYWMGKNRILGNFSYNTGRVLTGFNGHTQEEWRQAIGFAVRVRFWEQFSINTNFFYDFNKKATARWISDYSYSIGRYNWKPNNFNFGYENYLNNKYNDNISLVGQKFLEGYYFLSYHHNLPDSLNKRLSFDETTNLRFTYFARYSIRYRDEFNRTFFNGGKTVLGLSLRYTIFKNIYVEGAAYYYPEKYKRQPWDPDFTYGFGFFDWRSFRISLTYGNWAINRWPGEKNPYPKYGFQDGQFRFIINWIW